MSKPFDSDIFYGAAKPVCVLEFVQRPFGDGNEKDPWFLV